ncbi:MAG: phosphotransferase [Granulosicoccus sp.]|nr:phosphotransferase [Granulosicoccus sp.]
MNRTQSAQYRERVLRRATEQLLREKVAGVEYPGGKSRESYTMLLESGDSIIATRRDTLQRARLEVRTLTALNKHHAPVPELLANNHSLILLQQKIEGQRLSAALKDADSTRQSSLLSQALTSLNIIQVAATQEYLETLVTVRGESDRWLGALIERPSIIGEYLKIPAPELDRTGLIERLRIRTPRFVKWDTRPGNALVEKSGRVVWFDWEHAGKRNRLDDVAWLLCDEFVPNNPVVEESLLTEFVDKFSDSLADQQPLDYLMAYGTFHMVVRLGLILKHAQGEWWDLDHCIANDKVGITLECAQRICARGARWSAACPLTAPLSDWFVEVNAKLTEL